MNSRRYALRPWLVRALIPDSVMGIYILWSPSAPVYVGRSDTCLRRRLVEHSRNWPDIYFTFAVALSQQDAFAMESSLFDALGEHATSIEHSNRAAAHDPGCLFCIRTFHAIRTDRLVRDTVSA